MDLIRSARATLGAGLLMLAAAATAKADPVLWTLSGFTFNDGGTASGSFVYDADLNAYSAIDITTTAGTTRNGAHYTQLSFGVAPAALEVLFLEDGAGADQTGADVLYMAFSAALTDAGGLIPLLLVTERDCDNADCTTPTSTSGRAASGDVVAIDSAVPEPASFALLFAGLVGIGLHRRRGPARV